MVSNSDDGLQKLKDSLKKTIDKMAKSLNAGYDIHIRLGKNGEVYAYISKAKKIV